MYIYIYVSSFHQVPLLEENGEHNWVFDTISKKTMIGRLFTSMSGSVVTSGAVSGGRGSNRAKENANPNKKSKVAKAKAKAKAASSSGAALSVKDLPEECDVKKVTAACSVGVRAKVWVDDLLSCVRHTIKSIESMNIRTDLDLAKLHHDLIRTGLLFAMQGQMQLNTGRGSKIYKKWSTLRAAIKEHALWKLLEE